MLDLVQEVVEVTTRSGRLSVAPVACWASLEEQLVRWLSDFQPDEELRRHALVRVRREARRRGGGELRRPAERRRVLATLFDRVWQDGGAITAVKPRMPFLRYFQMADELARRRA